MPRVLYVALFGLAGLPPQRLEHGVDEGVARLDLSPRFLSLLVVTANAIPLGQHLSRMAKGLLDRAVAHALSPGSLISAIICALLARASLPKLRARFGPRLRLGHLCRQLDLCVHGSNRLIDLTPALVPLAMLDRQGWERGLGALPPPAPAA